MARLEVDVERLADPTAWPDRCARCGAHGTQLVPVPDKYAKGQVGWRMPLCPAHRDDWAEVRRKNRIGMAVILVGMAIAFGITWAVHPRFVNQPDEFSRFMASFMIGFVSVIPMAIVLALWAKTPIRIEQIQGRFAHVIGLGRAFKAAVGNTLAPAPLPEVSDEVRFEVSRYAPPATAAPESVGLLFAASVFLGGLFGLGVGIAGLELAEFTKGWAKNDWRFVLTVMATWAAFSLVAFGVKFPFYRVGLIAFGAGIGFVGLASAVLKLIGLRTETQFGLSLSGLPLLLLGVNVLHPIIWNQKIRHAVAAGFVSALGALVYAGAVYAVAGLADGPQWYALIVGPIAALVFIGVMASAARSPYCTECSAWLVSRRLGAVARPRTEMLPVIADGGLVALSAAKTYQETASVHDCELTAYRCPQCGDKGTVVLALSECQMSGGKNPRPTLMPVGKWQYPGHALTVIDTIFPPPPEEGTKEPKADEPRSEPEA